MSELLARIKASQAAAIEHKTEVLQAIEAEKPPRPSPAERKSAVETARAYKQRNHAKMLAGEAHPEHGRESTYAVFLCRCEPCRRAHSDRMREYNSRRVPGASTRVRRIDRSPEEAEKLARKAERQRAARQKNHARMLAGEVEVEHGSTNTYVSYLCRCDLCMVTMRKYWNTKKKISEENRRNGQLTIETDD